VGFREAGVRGSQPSDISLARVEGFLSVILWGQISNRWMSGRARFETFLGADEIHGWSSNFRCRVQLLVYVNTQVRHLYWYLLGLCTASLNENSPEVADIANVWAYRVLRLHTYLTEASSISRALRISSAGWYGSRPNM
jgi:hypothetical protein